MKSTPKLLGQIIEAIRSHKTFCVVGHVRPDGDCIGSQLGVAMALKAIGKSVVCWNEDPVPPKLSFLDPERMFTRATRGKSFDVVIATDCASYERLGEVGALVKNRKLLINIDHHQSNTRYGDINWVSAKEPSTGELVHRLLQTARWPVTPAIADCLFTAISTDTGSFQYPTTTPSTYQVAGELVKRGANLDKICSEVYQSYPLARVRLVRHVYNRFRLVDEDRVAYFWLKKADYSRAGAQPDDSEGLIDHIRAIEPVVIALLFEEIEPELTRISFRSKSHAVDVNKIANAFGGGGHAAAAGARIAGPPLRTQRRVIAAVRKALKDASRNS